MKTIVLLASCVLLFSLSSCHRHGGCPAYGSIEKIEKEDAFQNGTLSYSSPETQTPEG